MLAVCGEVRSGSILEPVGKGDGQRSVAEVQVNASQSHMRGEAARLW